MVLGRAAKVVHLQCNPTRNSKYKSTHYKESKIEMTTWFYFNFRHQWNERKWQ